MDLLIDEVRLWDGTGAAARDGMDVWIHDDRVVAVDDELAAPEGATVLDGRGSTAIPGLIDAHVHLSLDPGGALRVDAPAVRDELLLRHLAAYLACGVTTILDPAITFSEWSRVDAALSGGAVGPEFLALGPPLSPPGGYVSVVLPEFPSVGDRGAVVAQLDETVRRGGVGAKVTVEPGLLRELWPLHDPETFLAVREETAARELPVYVHARTPETWRAAFDALDVHALVHGLDAPDAALAREAAAAHVFVMPTLSILDANRAAWRPERLDEPLVRLVVPEVELATARDPDALHTFGVRMLEVAAPRAPAKGLVAKVMMTESTVRGRLRHASEATLELHRAGVPLVLGSDSGNWPIFPFEFHGPTSLRELELLVEAGLTPEQALVTATRNAAEMLGRDDLGRIAPGARADLVLVTGDPLQDLSLLRSASVVVARGEARSPAAWVEAARR